MLEPVRIPPEYTNTTMATQPVNAQRSLETFPNAAAPNANHPLDNSSSEDWSDKDHKDSLQSPTAPSTAHFESPDSPANTQNMFTADGGHKHSKGHNLKKKASTTLQSPRAWMGLQPMATLDEELDHAGHNHLLWPKIKIALKEPIAEFWGTFILVLFGEHDNIPHMLECTTNYNQVTLPLLKPCSVDRNNFAQPRLVDRATVPGTPSVGLGVLVSCWVYTLPVTLVLS